MEKNQQTLGLVFLGIISVVAIVGLILFMTNSPSGSVVTHPSEIIAPKHYVGVSGGHVDWKNLVGFTPALEMAVNWCTHHTISEGGIMHPYQRQGEKGLNCYVVDRKSVPPRYLPYFEQISYLYKWDRGMRVMACFTSALMTPPDEIAVCRPPEELWLPFNYN